MAIHIKLWDRSTQVASTTPHNDLAGLQGGASNDYYHMTSAQRGKLIQPADATHDGYLTYTDWNTFNNKGNGTVTSVSALTLGTTGTDLSSTVANGTTTPVITLNVPTASATNRGALSSTDWSTFNDKPDALSEQSDVNLSASKTTPVDADNVLLQDSADSNIWKKLTWSNIKATLKAYFDTLYQATYWSRSGGGELAPTTSTDTMAIYGTASRTVTTDLGITNYGATTGTTSLRSFIGQVANNGRLTLSTAGDASTISLRANAAAIFANSGGMSLGTSTTTPAYLLTMGGTTARTIGMERATSGAGNTLTVQSGPAQSGSTNQNGGNLLLKSATATGTGSSAVEVHTVTAGATGTTDRTSSLKWTFQADGHLASLSDTWGIKLGGGNDMSVDYDGTQGNIKTDLVAASDLHIDCGTDKTVVLDETVYVDIDFPIIIRTTGAGIPSLTTFNGNLTMPSWAVNDYNQCESQEFIHGWKEGSLCTWHLHLTTNGSDVDNRYVRFELEYAYTQSGAWQFPAVVTTSDILIPAGTATKTQIIMNLATFTPSSSKIGDHCVARLKRVAAAGTAPTNNPWIPMLQMHVQCDTIGSRQISTK